MVARLLLRIPRLLKLRLQLFAFLLFSFILIYSTGISEYPFALKFDRHSFVYPLDLPNFPTFIKYKLNLTKTPNESVITMKTEPVVPINSYPYKFTIKNKGKCKDIPKDKKCRRKSNGQLSSSCRRKLSLALVIKSSIDHVENRKVIRETWGYEDRMIDVNIKRLFILGSCSTESNGVASLEAKSNLLCQDAIDEENSKNKDIIQGDFLDSYYNNTVKTMMAFKWLNTYCSQIDYVLFVDDDYFVSPKNLIKLIRQFNEEIYSYGKKQLSLDGDDETNGENENDVSSNDDIDTRIYAGFVFNSSIPRRDRFGKWYVSLSQYPYSKYPPYVTAGAYLVSQNSLLEIYTASQYIVHFPYDDIYLGLITTKINLVPIHVREFHFYKKEYDQAGSYKNVIATHGYSDPEELREIWILEKTFGHV